jgi:recombinational DNA repair protein (RecF pathway)
MTKKLSNDVASKEMIAAGLTPLVDYPGNKEPWRCRCNSCGEEVTPSLGSVRLNGGGCRKCGIRKSANSRKLTNQVAISELEKSGATPLVSYPGINATWLSRCNECNREIKPRLGNIRKGHAACVYCTKKKVDPSDAIEFMLKNNLEPLTKYPGSNNPWKSKCLQCGEIVFPRYSGLVSGQGGCKKCGFVASSKKQRLPSQIAISLFEKCSLQPLEDFPGTNKPWKSKCLKCGQIVSPQYSSIKIGGGCAVCGKRQIAPEQAYRTMVDSNLKPLEDFPGGKSEWKCECLRCGKIVNPKYTDIQSGYGGCKYCGGHYVEPEAAVQFMKLQGFVPQEPYVNSITKWHCKCAECNRDVYPTYGSVKANNSGCLYCAKRKVDPEEASKFMNESGVLPLVPYPGARVGWQSTCRKCDMEVFPIYSHVRNQGANPCLYCAGKKVDKGSAFKIMVAAGLTPLEGYSRADKPWRCTCNKCERLVTPTYTSIRIGQGGCKYCAEKGIDFTAPAFLYLMKNDSFSALKVGIGNHKTRNNRVKEHEKNGWNLIKILDFSIGETAYQVEQSILKNIRLDKSLPPFLRRKQMPQGGYTETIDGSQITPEEIWEMVESEIGKL